MIRNSYVVSLLFAALTGCVASPPGIVDFVFNIFTGEMPFEPAADPVFIDEPIFDYVPDKVGSHAASITTFPDGELLAAWYSYDGPEELNGSAIYMARRPAGSERWGRPRLHIDRAAGDGNPVLYSEADNVWLFQAVVPFGWSTSHIEMQTSDDRGRTWSEPRAIAGPLGANTRYPPVRMADGRLLLPAYDNLILRSLFYTSTDGRDWTLDSIVFTGPPHQHLQPSVAKMKSGRLLAVMRDAGQTWMWVTVSDDNARSWTLPADSGFPNSGSPSALLRLASDNLLLVYNASRVARRPLSVALSPDGGETWTPGRVIADGESSYSYPSVAQTPDGLIHVVFSEARRRIRHVTLNEEWIVSP